MDKDRIPVTIIATEDGRMELRIDEKQKRMVVTSFSTAMCGAFDIAGEHEASVIATLRTIAADYAHMGPEKQQVRKNLQ